MTETAALGIDLASQPKLTALCRIDWTPGRRGYAYCPALDQSDVAPSSLAFDLTGSGIRLDRFWSTV
jgi:hypothetical protein